MIRPLAAIGIGERLQEDIPALAGAITTICNEIKNLQIEHKAEGQAQENHRKAPGEDRF